MAAEIAIKITADGKAVVVAAKQAENALQGIDSQAGKTGTALQGTSKSSEGLNAAMRKMDKSASDSGSGLGLLGRGAGMAATAIAAAGAAMAAGFVGKLISVQREFDALNSSLITVSGSSAAAAREMSWLKDFAKETPFGLAQATQGFVKMKALGLEPTKASLTSFGNTAAAMGKNLNQMVEAVADAATGEFERLKEFGIKAKQEGDKVSLTFQGVTQTIGNNAAEITQYLTAIGNAEFAGAMAERTKTLDGAISGLSDSWSELFRTISASGFSQAMTNSIKGVDGYLVALTEHMEAAKKSGAGMVGELNSGLGYIIARAPFDVLAGSANALNGVLNLLTGGVLKLNTSVDLLPDSFKTSEAQAVAMASKLKEAEADFIRLSAKFAQQSDNIYIKSELYALGQYIEKLKEAQRQQAALVVYTDPRESQPSMTRGASFARWNDEEAKSLAALSAERMKASGINKDFIASVKVHQDALRLGTETEAQATAAISALIKKRNEGSEAGKQAAKAEDAAAAAAKAAISQYESLMLRLDERLALSKQELDAGRQLTEAEKEQSKITTQLDSNKNKLNATQRASTEFSLAQVIANELLIQQQRTNIAAAQDLADQEAKRVETLEGALTGMADQNKSMAEEIELIGLNERAQLAVTQARQSSIIAIKEERLARMQNAEFMSREQIALEEEIRLLKERMNLTGIKGEKNFAAEQAKEASAEWTKFYDSIYNGLTDSLYRGFEAGKGFFKSFWDSIKNLFKTTVLKLAVQGVMSMTGLSGLAGAANATTGGAFGGGGTGSMLSMASSLQTTYNAIAGSFAALGNSVAFAAQDIGAWLVTNTTGALNSAGSSLMANSGALGTAASYVGAAAAGIAIGSMIAGDKELLGLSGTSSAAIGAAIGSIFGPIGTLIGGILGGVANAAFGMGKKTISGSGISGSFSSAGANVQEYADWQQKGGWFRSDKSGQDRSAIGAPLQNFLDVALRLTTSATQAYASAIGLSADVVNGYTQSINVNLRGLDEKGQQEAIGKSLSSFADGMASLYTGITALSKSGEGASTTLVRLANSLTVTNSWLSMLRMRLLQINLSGAAAAASLADAFGGLDKLAEASKTYYDAYFTDAEKAADGTREMSAALSAVNLALPESKQAYRALADSLDLNTTAGLQAYAVLLALAPAFDVVAQAATVMAQQTSEQLIKTFSGNRKLIPLLNTTLASIRGLGAGLVAATAATVTMADATGSINRLLGVASSGMLYFGSAVQDMGQPLSAAQVAARTLTDQIVSLKLNASGAVIDVNALGAALANVNTETFVATVTRVFENLAERIKDTLSSIYDERIAVREAALAIINPTVMTRDQIQRGIADANVGLPSVAGVVTTQNAVGAADAQVAGAGSNLADSTALRNAAESALASTRNQVDTVSQQISQASSGYTSTRAAYMAQITDRGWSYRHRLAMTHELERVTADYNANIASLTNTLTTLGGTLAEQQEPYSAYVIQQAADQAALTAATAVQTSALTAAKAAQLAYIDSLQDYAIDASKATQKLSQLRNETVKYYEQQKQLADLMAGSAATLRQTVADFRFGQLDPQQQFAQLQTQFNSAYSMALSTSGETLAGYGDKLNSLLNPLLQKAQEAGLTDTAYAQLVATALARAEAVAARIDQLTPTSYAADSLAMLAQIDSTLAALEEGSRSAERIIVDAINAGRDQTVGGLRAVVAAITGQAIPGFATGGSFGGGLRIVGENGPELEATGPSRIFNAGQTRSMLSGGANTELLAEVRALRQEVAALRADNRAGQGAIAANTGKLAKIADREYIEGKVVRTNADQPLSTVAA
jgi:hypothetical protein